MAKRFNSWSAKVKQNRRSKDFDRVMGKGFVGPMPEDARPPKKKSYAQQEVRPRKKQLEKPGMSEMTETQKLDAAVRRMAQGSGQVQKQDAAYREAERSKKSQADFDRVVSGGRGQAKKPAAKAAPPAPRVARSSPQPSYSNPTPAKPSSPPPAPKAAASPKTPKAAPKATPPSYPQLPNSPLIGHVQSKKGGGTPPGMQPQRVADQPAGPPAPKATPKAAPKAAPKTTTPPKAPKTEKKAPTPKAAPKTNAKPSRPGKAPRSRNFNSGPTYTDSAWRGMTSSDVQKKMKKGLKVR